MAEKRALWILLWIAVPSYAAGPTPAYIGAEACAKCHAEVEHVWGSSRHSKMLQPASPVSVKGDFTQHQVQLRGLPYGLREQGGVYYITESYLTGKKQEHRVEYTLGNRRIQHYLTALPSGRIIVLPPSWDVLRKQWMHSFDIGDPDETSAVMVQIWNKDCYSCHVSREEKHFDPATSRYKTVWQNFGTNCERCHGPGRQHAADYSAKVPPQGIASDIVLQTRLTPARNTMVCAQCHSFRDFYVEGFSAGADYYDYFLPILEFDQPVDKDPAYWPDGRTRRFSNDALGLWQSECYLKGSVTCVDCHLNAHQTEIEKNPQLRPDANAICTRCHQSIGQALTAHTHHTPTSTGSSCVECHMPRTVFSIKAAIRDHSMSIPVPENTLRHAIPNACNVCHTDRDANWTLQHMNQWYGAASRQRLIRRADAFSKARQGDPTAIAELLAILAAPSEGPLARANTVGYLSRFSSDARIYSESVFPAMERALSDPEPLVRATAALRMNSGKVDRGAMIEALTRALGDSSAVVRLGAGVSLVSLGVKTLPGQDGERFQRAKQAYLARADLDSDDPGQQLVAGKFYLLTDDPAHAVEVLQNSLRLNPDAPARYYLAYAYAQQGHYVQARDTIETIVPADPQYSWGQELLKSIAAWLPH